MKKVFILAMISVWMISCSESTEAKTDSVAVDSPVADTVAIVPDSITPVVEIPAETTPLVEFPVQLKVLYTSNYCGGARPSEEMIAEKATPKLLTSSTLKFKNHFSGTEYFLTTDASGIVSTKMEEGKYDVFLTKDISSGLSTGFDPKCSLWLNQVLCQVKIKPDSRTPDVTIHFICNPCNQEMKRQ